MVFFFRLFVNVAMGILFQAMVNEHALPRSKVGKESQKGPKTLDDDNVYEICRRKKSPHYVWRGEIRRWSIKWINYSRNIDADVNIGENIPFQSCMNHRRQNIMSENIWKGKWRNSDKVIEKKRREDAQTWYLGRRSRETVLRYWDD